MNIKKISVCFLISFFLLVLGKGVAAFDFPQKRPIVSRITFKSEGELTTQGMKELITVKEGNPFSLQEVTKSIKQIYQTGLFSDIQVLKKGREEIELIFLLTKKFSVRKISISDSGKIPRKKIKKGLFSLRRGSAFSEYKLKEAEKQVKQLLREEGYFSPEIEMSTEKKPGTSLVDVFLKVESFQKYMIQRINFSGNVILSEKRLKEEMKSEEGERYVPSRLEEDLQRLKQVFSSMDYFWAEIEVEKKDFDQKENKVSLLIKIIPHEKIKIVVRGAQVPLDLLKPLWEERIFKEWGLEKGEAKIIHHMRKKNYLFAQVSASIQREDHHIRVIYDIQPGQKYKIGELRFEELNYFTPVQLKRELEIARNIPLIGGVDGARLFELPQEIESLYKSHGFTQTRVSLNFNRFQNKVNPILYVKEGSQKRIESIEIQGASAFSRERILEQIQSTQEGPFYKPRVKKDPERLENFYLQQGFRETEVKVKINRREENLYSLLFQIEEGNKVEIENVIINGNVITRDKTILKELLVREGDYARYDLIRKSERRLERLGIFSEIKIEEIPLSPEKENLLIRVREGERNYASLGLGLETKEEPRSLDISQNVIRLRGTAELVRSNILGTAAQLSLVGQFSLKEKRGVVSWEQPYFLGLPLETFVNAWLEREARKSFSFDRRGVTLTTIKSLSKSDDMVFLTTLRWAQTTLFDLQIEESEVDRQHSPFSSSSISGSFIWDKRDDAYNPEKGYFFSSVLEWAYPLFQAESNFLKSFTKYQQYFPIFSDVRFSLTSRLGLGRGKIPIHERFFGGGSNSFRGVEFDELGPKDPQSSKPVGGKALFLVNMELTFPLYLSLENLHGVVFYDKGNVFAQRKDFSLASLQDAVGAGLRYQTPLGPVRLELGWNLDAPSQEKNMLMFITIGNVF
ncbi:outer membrane protein assembly factor BamA [bacterium]|nr:outer membrane protein assembly factor BamA [bacterium]